MDHQDWPGWPEDDPHLGDADTAHLGGTDDGPGEHPLGHDPMADSGYGHDPLAGGGPGDEPGHGYGHDEYTHDEYGRGEAPDAGGHGHFETAYPEDDPFAPVDHASDDSLAHHAADAPGVEHD